MTTTISQDLIDGYRMGLDDLTTMMISELESFLSEAASFDAAMGAQYVRDGYPEIWTPYAATAGELSSAFYSSIPSLGNFLFAPAPGQLPTVGKLVGQVVWAFAQPLILEALIGVAQRDLWRVARDTVVQNSKREGAKWARQAQADACRFCQIVATRGAVYGTKKSATKDHDSSKFLVFKDDYHKHCRCVAVPVRSGVDYEPPEYVHHWTEQYEKAAKMSSDATGSRNMKGVMAAFRQLDKN